VEELLEVVLPCDVASAAVARAAVSNVLSDRCPAELVEDALIVVSELVSNAVQHTGEECVLVVTHLGDAVAIEVRDADPSTRSAAHADREPNDLGRGLGAVQTLSTRWGVERTENGKCVWAELDLPASWPSQQPAAGSMPRRV
jgi:anti-sigma regulatory factor (Ser/Thr protein kinase)